VVVVAMAAVTIFGLPGPGPVHRSSARALSTLADHVNAVCGSEFGDASVDWLSGSVDYPSGVPVDLTPDERAMLGTGAKIGCLQGAITAKCDEAIAALSATWSDDMEPVGLLEATLTACGSKQEWIATAERHLHDPTPATGTPGRSPIIAGSELTTEQLWERFCGLRGNVTGPAPACDNR
jgi:hypothetical protein